MEDNLSMEDKMDGPKVSFIRRFHCMYQEVGLTFGYAFSVAKQ